MPIKTIEILSLSIPFKTSFKHASAERKISQSVLVIAKSDKNYGIGEGCPREYVTNESIASAIDFLSKNKAVLLEINTLEKLQFWIKNNAVLIDKNPAAWCAVELAILDLLAKENEQSLEGFLGLSELKENFQYSAILGDSSIEVTASQIDQYLKFGLKDFKFKISGNLEEDKEKLNLIRSKIDVSTIRIDANNLWDSSIEANKYLSALPGTLIGIEEPLKPFDYTGLLELYAKIKIPIILDESFLNLNHFEHLTLNPSAFMINLRISKMGGIIRSLEIAKKASVLNIPLIVGAQVGETSILTRAALSVVNSYRKFVKFQEGAFGTLLLSHDIVSKPMQFGQYGLLNPEYFLNKDLDGFQMDFDLSLISTEKE